jgi:ATP-dependent Zn protease
MKNYTVYFEIYGKKIKSKVLAESMIDAQSRIKEKIKFHKVVEDEKDDFNQLTDILDSMINILGSKRK